MLCRQTTLDAEAQDAVLQVAAADLPDGVLLTAAKFSPLTVRLSVVVKPRLGLKASLTTGAKFVLLVCDYFGNMLRMPRENLLEG